jgi:hypothetical protein
MHKSAMKCNETVGKSCINKHGASKIIDTLETYHSTSSFLLVKLNVCIFIFALFAGTICQRKTNEWNVGIPRSSGTASGIYLLFIFSFSFICRLARFECFLCWPSNVSAPKAALRLSCYPKPGFMASKSRCRRLYTHEKQLRKDKASKPTFFVLQR